MTTPSLTLGQRCFTGSDQQHFARLTGDTNPMHMDALAARRLITGRPVVHGIHTLLAALELLAPHAVPAGAGMTCDFVNPVCVGDGVDFSLRSNEDGQAEVHASVQGLDCTRISWTAALTTAVAAAKSPPAPGRRSDSGADSADWATLTTALDHPAAGWVGQRFGLSLPLADFAATFPRTCARLGERRVAAIGLLSYCVGMVCPGLHSVFSSLTLEPGPDRALDSAYDSDMLRFEVLKYDARFRLFVLAFDGCLRGQLRAFLRPNVQAQPSTESLLGLLRPDEFQGRHALVIGGSRGLGELMAKLVAAGGGDVTLTYAAGAHDAQQVAGDINRCRRGHAQVRALDIVGADFSAWLGEAPTPDAVFYFATPRIFRKKAGTFDGALLDEFLTFYVHRFDALCAALEQRAAPLPVRVLIPSTVFIDERPKGMTEYAMAKAAAEVLSTDLGKTLHHVQLLSRRLPKLATDQTASLMATRQASNIDTLLPLVRELLDPPAADAPC